MDLNKGLPVELKIVNQDYSWTQALDYENVSFRCRSYYDIGHLAKACPKTSQSYRHRKAMWWTGARPEHYTVSNVESAHEGTEEFQQKNITEAIQANKEPLDEPPLEVSKATLENLTKSLG